MSLNTDGTLRESKDDIIVWKHKHKHKDKESSTVSFIIDGFFFTFAKTENNKVILVAKDRGFIPKQKFAKALKKAYAILSK